MRWLETRSIEPSETATAGLASGGPAGASSGTPERTVRGAALTLVAGVSVIATSLAHKLQGIEGYDLTLIAGALLVGAAVALAASPASRHVFAKRTRSLLSARQKIQGRMERLSDLQWQIEDSAARYRDLLDELDAVVCRRDGNGRLTFVNRAFCRMFGVAPDAVLGTTYAPVSQHSACLADFPPIGQPRRTVCEVPTTLGPRWLSFVEHQVPATTPDGPELQCVGRDVTEDRIAERHLAVAKAQAEDATRAKSRFLAAVSHEIRTPMNGILGMVGLLGDTQQTLEQQSYARTIDQSARTLLGLIDEVLDFSRLEARRLTLEPAPFDLELLVQDAMELMAPRAFDKDLEFVWTIDRGLPSRFQGDAARIRQILLNLVGNAIKFTDRGGVWITIGAVTGDDRTAATTSQQPLRLALDVRDTGIGLAPDAMQRIFDEFEQASGAATDRRGGTGLGLAISQALARAMDGDITVRSRPQRGSTFTVELPLVAVLDDQTPAWRAGARGNTRVLLMYDRLIERRGIAAQLTSAGVTVDETDTAEGPALVFEARAAGQPYDAVIVDGEDGASDLAGLIEHSVTRGLVVMSPSARADLKAFRSIGFDEFLIRPVRPRTLEARVFADAAQDDVTASPRDEAEPRSPEPTLLPAIRIPATGKRVLLVEDNPVNELVARRTLERMGCEVIGAPDGEAAVQFMRRVFANQDATVEVILMDMHMPRMGGIEAARAIRDMSAGVASTAAAPRQPAIIAVTASAFEEDRQRCLAAGMDDYLAKPFGRAELETCINRWSTSGSDCGPSGQQSKLTGTG